MIISGTEQFSRKIYKQKIIKRPKKVQVYFYSRLITYKIL